MNIPTFFLFSINNRAFHHLFLYETFWTCATARCLFFYKKDATPFIEAMRTSAKEVFYRLRMKNGPSLDAPVKKYLWPASCFKMKKRRYRTVYRGAKGFVQVVWCFHAVGFSPPAGLPVLWHAAGGCVPQQRVGRHTFNDTYCKWSYADGQFIYTNLENLINFLVSHMANEANPPTQMCAYLETLLSTPEHWKNDKRLSSPFRILCYDSRGC